MRVKRSGASGDDAGWPANAHPYLRTRESDENFPVALRLLPATVRRQLRAVYDVARVIDDLGDQAAGDRTAQLIAFRSDLDTIWAGGPPQAPVLRNLAQTVGECGLSRQPFVDLIEANLRDQTVTEYPTFGALLEYCALSANPVGRIVLEIFAAMNPQDAVLSDHICTALQIIEHCQDVAEDHRAGRIYLPQEDLARFGVARRDLEAVSASPAMRALIQFEAERAQTLLGAGLPLISQLRGWARIAVSGYAAGGLAAVRAMRRSGWSVLPKHPAVRRLDVLRELTVLSGAWLRPRPARSDQAKREGAAA